MPSSMKIGHVVDVGHYWAVIASVFQETPAGIELNRFGSGNMPPSEARRLADVLLQMADACDRINRRRDKQKKQRSSGKALRFKVLSRDGFRCRYCGASGAHAVLHVDHVLPRVEGGTDDESNLVTACQDCNLGKGRSVVSYSAESAP